MQNVIKIIILLVFFPTITSKYVYQLSGKTLFFISFDFLGFRNPHFQEIRYFLCLLELGVFSLSNFENVLISAVIANT